jgi:cell division protein FtsW
VRGFLSPDVGYQTGQALEAIRRGGLFGVGPGEGLVKRALPDAHTDFVFAVAGEEFGLIFMLGLIGLIATVVLRLLKRARDVAPTPSLAAGGLALLIGGQALINIAVNLNLAPPKGMTLPFVSYGGSSLIALGFAGGLALAFTRRPAQTPAQSSSRLRAGARRVSW